MFPPQYAAFLECHAKMLNPVKDISFFGNMTVHSQLLHSHWLAKTNSIYEDHFSIAAKNLKQQQGTLMQAMCFPLRVNV